MIAVVCVVLVRVYYRITDDFRLGNIKYEMGFHPEWEIATPTAEEQTNLDQILEQPFTYIGKGAQSYAFSSADQKYVLKFFKFKHLRPSLITAWIPNLTPFSSYLEKEEARKTRKRNGVFRGYKLAYDVNKNESGIIFIQLNPNHISKLITVIDKIGLKRTVDLGEVPYVLQEKGQTLRTVLTNLLKQGNSQEAQVRIGQIFDLYLSEYQKGIYDHDHGIMHNTGFVGNRPFHLDVGKLSPDENISSPVHFREDLIIVGKKIDKWLYFQFPEQRASLSHYMEERITATTNDAFKFPLEPS